MGVEQRREVTAFLGAGDRTSGTSLERAMLDLGAALGGLTVEIQERTLWPREQAIHYNRLSIASRTAAAYHKREWERQYREEIMGVDGACSID